MTIEANYVGNGSTVLYSFTFSYIEVSDIKASLDGVVTTAFTLANSTTVEFTTAPTNGVAIRIYRDTTVDNPKATFFPGSAIRAQDLNDNFEQSLFVVQEASFNTSEAAADSAQALATANTADAKSDQANVQSAAAEASAAQAAIDAASAQAVQIGFTPIYNTPGDDQSGIKYLDSTFPIDAAGGVTLPDETSAWEDNGAIRYNDSLNKIELYEGTRGEWVTAAGGAQVQSTPPSPASTGDVWWDPTDGRSYVYYVDVDSSQWVEMNPSWNGSVADNTVSTNKIVNGAVTPAKLDRAYLETTGNVYMYGDYFLVLPDGASGAGMATGTGAQDGWYVFGPSLASAPGRTGAMFNQVSSQVGANATFTRKAPSTTGAKFIDFWYGGTNSGSITLQTSSSVLYNTTSDYRLKENVVPITEASSKLKQLKPYAYNYISNPEMPMLGFLAHEVAEVLPAVVTGEKDAVDEEGNPVHQQMDYSKLTPILTATLQESLARIEALEAEVQQLKGGSN